MPAVTELIRNQLCRRLETVWESDGGCVVWSVELGFCVAAKWAVERRRCKNCENRHTSPLQTLALVTVAIHNPHSCSLNPVFYLLFTVGVLSCLNHELISYVFEGCFSMWMWIRNVGMETFGPHGLILCVSEGLISWCLCMYNACMETLCLHELILCVSEDLL